MFCPCLLVMLAPAGVTRLALLVARLTKSTASFVSMIPSLVLSLIALFVTPGFLRSIGWRYAGIVDAHVLPAVVVVIGLIALYLVLRTKDW